MKRKLIQRRQKLQNLAPSPMKDKFLRKNPKYTKRSKSNNKAFLL